MSRLQERVKPVLLPMIQGSWPEEISDWHRTSLASWAAMFTMVVEHADPRTQITHFEHRDTFRLTLDPPSDWSIWIGRHRGVLWWVGWDHRAWSMPVFVPGDDPADFAREEKAALTRKFEAQTTSWILGGLYFQAASTLRPGFKVDQQAFATRHGLSVVWPGSSIVRPTKILDDFDAANAAEDLLPPPHRSDKNKPWEVW